MDITQLIKDLERISDLVSEDEIETAYDELGLILNELRIIERREEKSSSLDTDQEKGNRE